MKDIFINSKRIDEHFNGARPLEGEYQKTVIIVKGNGGIGKSTLCQKLTNKTIEYISVDVACLLNGFGLKVIDDFLQEYGNESIYNIHILSQRINDDDDCEKFVYLFFQKYILNSKSENVLLDGYLFVFPKIHNHFMLECTKNNCRVWCVERIV